MDEAKALAHHGIEYGPPQINIDKLRGFKDGVVKKLTGGLAGPRRARSRWCAGSAASSIRTISKSS